MKKLARSVKTRIRECTCYVVSHICRFDPRGNILVFSEPRSGSTWVAEVINQVIPRTVILWEPLYLKEVKLFRDLNFAWRQYIPEHVEWKEAQEAFSKVFRGKVLNTWTCGSSPLDFLKAERMVIKFCRANAMIPWLTRVFHFNYAPIYLVRHPFAVISSQLKHGAWGYKFSGYEIPSCPFRSMYERHADFLMSLRTKYEALVATWCLSNLVPLTSDRNDKDWITIYYEHLITNPEKEIKRIFDRWNMPVPDGTLEKLREPSSATKEATFLRSVEGQLYKWRDFFNEEQIERMAAVLEYFGVQHYNSRDVYPIASTLPQ